MRSSILLGLGALLALAAPADAGRLPRYGGHLRVPLASLPASVDPLRLDGDDGALVGSCLFEGLTRWEGVDIVPGIALQWIHDDQDRRWRFLLRNDVLFHDGTRCDAAAVRQSLRRLADPRQSRHAWLLSNLVGWEDFTAGRTQDIEGIEAPETYVLELRFALPVAELLARLALPAAGIARRKGDEWAGTGPFVVQSAAPGELVLGMFRDHHAGRPYLDRIEFVSRTSGEKAIAGDVVEMERVLVGAPLPAGAARWREPAARLGIAVVHPKSVELASADIRQRLATGFDRAVFVRAVLGGDGEGTQLLSPREPKTVTSRATEPAGDLATRPQQRARIVVPASEPVLRALGERLQVHLFALGLAADLEVLAEEPFTQALTLGNYDIVVLGWTPPQPRVDALEAATRIRVFATSVLVPLLGAALPDGWSAARIAAAKDPESVLLRGDLCIPLVLYHDLWQTSSDLLNVQLGAAMPVLGVANAHLEPHTP